MVDINQLIGPPGQAPELGAGAAQQAPTGIGGGLGQEQLMAEQQAQPWEEQPTDEEQAEYTQAETIAHTVMFKDKKARKAVLDMLKSGKDTPPETLSNVAMTLLKTIDGDEKSPPLPEGTILPIGAEIIEQAGTTADAAGIFPVDETVLGKAAQYFVLEAAEQYGMEQEDAKGLMEGLDEQALQGIKTGQEQYWKDTPIDQGGIP